MSELLECLLLYRIVLSTSHQWGAEITKLDVPADWRGNKNTACLYVNSVPVLPLHRYFTRMSPSAVWQIWLLLLSFFLASAVAFYTFFKHTTLL
jgi:prolactin regulatory element-binding protein